MSIADYEKKRRFDRTPEPRPSRRFVVHRHEASHLHYDLRLEVDGVLKSWAVPKGPSMNPRDKHLAVHVEDHPLEYRDFEGVIPEGNYGAGSVMIWDEGTYRLHGDFAESFEKGHIVFDMEGTKLHGTFALVRLKRDPKNWLLIKKNDEFASEVDILEENLSAHSGHSAEEIAAGTRRQITREDIGGDGKKVDAIPEKISPMLASPADKPFDRDDWIFEIKFDGYRALAHIEHHRVRLYSRRHQLLNDNYPEVIAELKELPKSAVLDGEIVVVDADGIPHFQALQEFNDRPIGTLVYFVFDILFLGHYDIRGLPLLRRKELLKKLLPQNLIHVRYVDHVENSGLDFFDATGTMGLEGMIAKDGASVYMAGVRSPRWLKIKRVHTEDVVIVGFTAPRTGQTLFGALILGEYERGSLKYIGHAGTGFSGATLKSLYKKMKPLIRVTSPFEVVPKTNMPATWIEPQLICEVSYSERTRDGQLRHPVFVRLRDDKVPEFLQPELPQKIKIHGHELQFTNLKKVFWKDDDYIKRDLIAYYQEIAPIILPYLRDRPQSMNRFPHGIDGKHFYQKNVQRSTLPDWIETVEIFSESEHRMTNYVLCQNEETLLYLANLACIELNVWNSRVGQLDMPDYMVIDLDPNGSDFSNVLATAHAYKKILDALKITATCKTSGKTGLHIYVPTGARYSDEQIRQFAEVLANLVHAELPRTTSIERAPSKRRGLVYLDFLQNIRGQTMAAPYCVRPVPHALVSAPVSWEEIADGVNPAAYTMRTMPARIEQFGDLWKPTLGKGFDMERALKELGGGRK